MKSKARPRESTTGEPSLHLPCSRQRPPPRGSAAQAPCCCSRMTDAFITTAALQTPLRALAQHRRVSRRAPRAPWPGRTVASAGSPSQPPHFHKADITTPKPKPLRSQRHGTREPRGALEIQQLQRKSGHAAERVQARESRRDQERSSPQPSPAAPILRSLHQTPPEEQEPRPWALSHGWADRDGHPRGMTLGVKATFPPATALPALPSKPDFNSNVSFGVINKPCNLLLQRAGVPAASAG